MPPLNALRAFEATARHLSFSKAAEELHVTPAALSHQIRGLEEMLARKLFDRRARSIALTEAARLIYPGIQTGFQNLREALERLERASQDNVLVISATPGLTAKWLAPRLYRFLAKHPDIDPRISASVAYANFVADGVDVGIRLSSGVHPELHVEKLCEEWLVPVCSPRLLEGPRRLQSPQDLAHFPLIQVDLPGIVPTWSDWLHMVGVDGVDTTRGLRLNVADHALDAAGARPPGAARPGDGLLAAWRPGRHPGGSDPGRSDGRAAGRRSAAGVRRRRVPDPAHRRRRLVRGAAP